MRSGTAVDREAELRRLREELYRPSPPPGAVQRYTALLGERAPESAAPAAGADVLGPLEPDPAPAVRRRAGRVIPAAIVASAVVAALVVVLLMRPDPADPGAAVPLVAGGPYAVSDREVLSSLTDRVVPDSRLVLRAVQGSELPQLDVWDTREAGVWVQQGRGPLVRRFEGQRPPAERARPFSIVVQCPATARYRWTITGTTPDRSAAHVLETAAADCGPTPTVATFTRPVGAVVTGFDLAVPDGVRWGMAFVYPIGDA